ncbi:MAG: cytochrome c maturation protein CcmE [Pseudomonadota bacterium]|nr:cytochrome c maturation protein CcmE [Pseudomonadota bacterium]
MRPKRQRLVLVLLGMLFVGAALAFSLAALDEELDVFRSPTEIAEQGFPAGKRFRVGGLVEDGSVAKAGIVTTFRVTDGANALTISYDKILPDLFRPGQGVVALGVMAPDGRFMAQEVLAKHDENYMPPEVADALKKSGHFKPEAGGQGS